MPHDIGALCTVVQVETLPWDDWGLMQGDEERFTMSADALLWITQPKIWPSSTA